MNINKDTKKAIDAGKTLIEYCARYKDCRKCVFWHESRFGISCCSVGCPFEYKMIFSPYEEKGADNEEK